MLPIAPATCYAHAAIARDPDPASDRARQDATGLKEIKPVHDESKGRYGARKDSRPDWDSVRVKIMHWSLRVKLAQNWREFGRLLLSAGDRPIVEQSRKDDFWGAKVVEDGTLVGMNVLGRLLMELREQLKGDEAESLHEIEPLAIPEFILFRQQIEAIQASPNAEIPGWTPRRPTQADAAPPPPSDPQLSLFEQPMISSEQAIEPRQPATPAEMVTEPGRYPAYKPARVHWLGEIWRTGRKSAENTSSAKSTSVHRLALKNCFRSRTPPA